MSYLRMRSNGKLVCHTGLLKVDDVRWNGSTIGLYST